MGIERIYDTATRPGLSIIWKKSEKSGPTEHYPLNIAVGDVCGPCNVMVALEYTIVRHTMTGSFTCNRFDHFPGFSLNAVFSWPHDLQFWTVRERY